MGRRSGADTIQAAFALLGASCVAAAVCIICGTVFTYFHTVFPMLMEPRSIAGVCNFVVAVWLSFNLLFNYVMVVRTEPGQPSRDVLTPDELEMAARDSDDEAMRWCQKCDGPKPPRAHHCSICGACVLKMDHHCPWINACVGHHNHRYFVLFLLHLWLSVAYAVVTIMLHWFGVLVSSTVDPALEEDQHASVVVCFVVCAALCVVIGGFLVWSGHLALTNQTTIEYLANRQRMRREQGHPFINPFDCGTTRRNVQQLVGPFRWAFQAILPSATPLDLDGHHWPQCTDFSWRCAGMSSYV
eukprot:TRINITY_DN19377_c0_g1_i1.p1 TRINITY_DN19377_c0_g1~~TRINITY_DN19377_c0_g1_i1.p1  ORF type:complete len:300 (+),score=90.55 TRINITY_DN19377_c0_g1_i1:121-1020(+)